MGLSLNDVRPPLVSNAAVEGVARQTHVAARESRAEPSASLGPGALGGPRIGRLRTRARRLGEARGAPQVAEQASVCVVA